MTLHADTNKAHAPTAGYLNVDNALVTDSSRAGPPLSGGARPDNGTSSYTKPGHNANANPNSSAASPAEASATRADPSRTAAITGANSSRTAGAKSSPAAASAGEDTHKAARARKAFGDNWVSVGARCRVRGWGQGFGL